MMTQVHAPPRSGRTTSVLGYPLFDGTRGELIEFMLHAARSEQRALRVGYLNADQYNKGETDPAFRERLRSMDLLYADGQSIVWAARREGASLPERLTAADFIGEFLTRAAGSGMTVALVGGHPGSADAFASFWKERIPNLGISYSHHGFFDEAEMPRIIQAVRESAAQVVLVGMGAPRQEVMVERIAEAVGTRIAWGVGALFEYGGWGKRRAPAWMRKNGLEWAFRLAQEPRRLAGRYLIGNPLFVWRALMRERR